MNWTRLGIFFGVALVLTVSAVALLVNIFERQQEARTPYYRVAEIAEGEPDPEVWGQNFRGQYDSYSRTERSEQLISYAEIGRYGGPEPYSKLERDPALTRLFAGYPFEVEYNEDRGHLNAIEDVTEIKRLGDNKPGTCFTCKSSNVPGMMNELGVEGFYATPMNDLLARFEPQHSISCADCHDADTMEITISRPAFREAMERRGIDLENATRQEMRTYACAQCHVEYYFKGDGKYLVFPWDKGLGMDEIEAYYDEIDFKDWVHKETGAPMVKMQHPDFEMWSSGIHARAGVSCPDCHMAYMRDGAAKISDHWMRSPLSNISTACGTCHRVSEEEMRSRVLEIQDRTRSMMEQSEQAILDAQDAIQQAIQAGASDQELEEARQLQRRAFIRVDFVNAESSMGFHSPQEAVRILGSAADYARQSQLAASKLVASQQ